MTVALASTAIAAKSSGGSNSESITDKLMKITMLIGFFIIIGIGIFLIYQLTSVFDTIKGAAETAGSLWAFTPLGFVFTVATSGFTGWFDRVKPF